MTADRGADQNTQGVPDGDTDADTASGGPPDPPDGGGDTSEETPPGGDTTTNDQLEADNEVEEDTVKTLRPDDPP